MIREHKQTIAKLRRQLAAKAATASTVAHIASPAPVTAGPPITATGSTSAHPPSFDQRSFIEQQTALHLAQMAQSHPDLGLSTAKVSRLVDLYEGQPIDTSTESKGKGKAACRDASPETVPDDELEKQDKSLPDDERRFLEALQELIRRKLNGTGSSGGA